MYLGRGYGGKAAIRLAMLGYRKAIRRADFDEQLAVSS